MVAGEGETIRCGECGQTYAVRVFAIGLCVRCGSRRLNSDMIEPANTNVKQVHGIDVRVLCVAC